MTIVERLAAWAASADPAHTEAARAAARRAFQDTVGCMVAGAGDAGAARVRAGIAGLGDGPSAVCGRLAPASAPYAALANGTAAHALDFDDTFLEAISHSSAVLVPVLLALGDAFDAPGPELIDAYIVGLEVHGALGKALIRAHYEAGWHSTATIGVIGAAAAAARLMDLDAARLGHALALSFSSAAGSKVQFGSMAKPLHAGLAAKNGIEAATLAEAGVEGRLEAFEAPMGLIDLMGGAGAPGWDHALDTLGAPLAIERQGLTIKRFPCCAATHRALDAVLDLMAEHAFTADAVAGVDVRVRPGHVQNLRYDDPRTELEARFSMPYCMAVALTQGTVRLADFTPDAVTRPEVRAMMPRISMHPHDLASSAEDDRYVPSIVTVTLADGRELRAERGTPKGDPLNPLSQDELDTKFRDCCENILAPADVDALHDRLIRLDALAGTRDLTRLLRFEAGTDRGGRFRRRA